MNTTVPQKANAGDQPSSCTIGTQSQPAASAAASAAFRITRRTRTTNQNAQSPPFYFPLGRLGGDVRPPGAMAGAGLSAPPPRVHSRTHRTMVLSILIAPPSLRGTQGTSTNVLLTHTHRSKGQEMHATSCVGGTRTSFERQTVGEGRPAREHASPRRQRPPREPRRDRQAAAPTPPSPTRQAEGPVKRGTRGQGDGKDVGQVWASRA